MAYSLARRLIIQGGRNRNGAKASCCHVHNSFNNTNTEATTLASPSTSASASLSLSAPLIGAHMTASWTSRAGSLQCLQQSKAIGANTMQIFTKSNRTCLQASGLRNVVAHASYLINLATDNEELLRKSTQGLQDEMERCQVLGIQYLILHPGSHGGIGVDKGIYRIAERLTDLMSKTSDVSLLLENSAGQGTSVGSKISELAAIYSHCSEKYRPRIGFCIDTCHAFSAGYELRSEDGFQSFMDEVGTHLGWDKLKCIHLNDSKTDLGGRSDRHANIGLGKLTLFPFWKIMNDKRLQDVPKILETPAALPPIEEIKILIDLIGKEEAPAVKQQLTESKTYLDTKTTKTERSILTYFPAKGRKRKQNPTAESEDEKEESKDEKGQQKRGKR